MFNKICIKSKELNNQKIDIAFLIETMLFYGKVIVLAHKEEIKTLLTFFDEDTLEELIKSGRLDLRVREDILGSMKLPNGKYNVELLSKKDETYSGILYQAHRDLINSSNKNLQFSDKFSKLTQPFRYGEELISQIKMDFENQELLAKLLPIYLNFKIPNFKLPSNIKIEILKEKPFGSLDSYSLNSNIDLEALNKVHKENNPDNFYQIDYSGFLLSLAESKGDIFIASQFESELVTNELYSKFIDVQLTEIIRRRVQSEDNINLFDEYVLNDCHKIGDAFIKKIITKKELLKLLDRADKFREWLKKVPANKNLIGEYYSAVTRETFADKLPTKTVRFILFEGIGITIDILGAGGIGTTLSTGLALFDQFYLDKLTRGWKPNQYINETLKPKIKK